MTEVLQEVYDNLTFDDACCIIREKLGNMAANYVAIGFFLRRTKKQELYKAGGYESIHDMAKTEFGMARQTTDHCMAVNRKFSKDGDSPMLAEQYRGFSKSQLQEMLYLTDEQLETVAPEMTVKEIRNVRKDIPDEEPKMKVELQKPSRGQEEYLNQFAKYFINQNFQWMCDDHMNRVTLVDRSPEEIKAYLGKNNRTWYFAAAAGTAHMNLFDDYVQLWDEKGICLGNYDWFYLAAAIQGMWNDVSLERTKAQQEKEKCSTSSIELEEDGTMTWKERCQKGECPPHVPACTRVEWGTSPEWQSAGHKECEKCWSEWQKRQTVLQKAQGKEPTTQAELEGGTGRSNHQGGQCEVQDDPEVEGPCPDEEFTQVIDGEYHEVKENAEEKYTARYFLEEQKEKLDNLLWSVKLRNRELLASEEKAVERQKMIVAALANMVTEMEIEELKQQIQAGQRQPELPVMKNNDQRKAWLADYKAWGLWYEDDHIGVKYYKYDFENGAQIITEVYQEEATGYCEAYETHYFHLVSGPEPPKGAYGIGKWTRHERYSRHPNSDTELVEFLKEIQKGAKA